MAGCITGRPEPELDFFGYKDVQIWNLDAQGRLNGDPGFDYMDPHCFCFDCRGAFDPKATVDAELVNRGHVRACFVYASLLPKVPEAPQQPNTGGTQQTASGFSNDTPLTSTSGYIPLLQRSNGGGIGAM